MWVPLKIKNKKQTNIEADGWLSRQRAWEVKEYFFLFYSLYFFLKFTEIGQSEFIGSRTKVLYATRATRGYQKHEISPRIQVKIREILIFSFSQIYGVLMV